MALKRKIDKTAYDKLSDELKTAYKADGNEFVLQTEGDEDTGALQRAHKREKGRADDLEAKLNAAEAERDELKAGRTSKDRDLDRLTKAHNDEIAKLKRETGETISKKDRALEKLSVDNLADSLARQISTAPAVMLPHIRARLTADLSGDEPAVKVLGKDGKPSDMTVDKLKEEFLANKDFSAIIVASRASGGGAPRNGSPSGGAGSQQTQKAPLLTTLGVSDLKETIAAQIAADQR